MKNLAIARRYAKALMLIGTEDGEAETYRNELDGFAKLITENKDLEQAVCNPLYNTAARKQVLMAIIDKLSISAVMTSFLLLLFDKGRMKFISDINEFYHKLADELKGLTRANLISASELTTETVEQIRESLSNMTGKNIILELEQDPEIIGGIITKIGDLVLDGSVKTQLLNMKKSLKRGERV